MNEKQLKAMNKIYPEAISNKAFNRHWPKQSRDEHHKCSGLELLDYRNRTANSIDTNYTQAIEKSRT